MKTYLRILSYGQGYFGHGAIGFLLLFLYNLTSVFSLMMVIPFLEILFGAAEVVVPQKELSWLSISSLKEHLYYYMGTLGAEGDKFSLLIYLSLLIGVLIFLKNLFRYFSAYFISPLEQGVIHNLRKKLFEHLARLSMNFFTGEKKGNVINVMVSDVQVIQQSVIGTIQRMISDPMTMLLFLVAMFFISWKLTLFTLIVLPVSGGLIAVISKSLKRKARRGQERQGNLIAVLDEFISGIRIVKAFTAEDFEKEKYSKENDSYRDIFVKLKRQSALASPLTEVLSILVVIGVLLFGGNMVLSGNEDLTAGNFIGFVTLFAQFLAPIKSFSMAVTKIQKGIASFNRVEEFLAVEEQVVESANPKPLKEIKQGIEFRNVGFKYEEDPILTDVNLELKKGEMIALVGPSGGGKSTLGDLLPRFYDPLEGGIFIDGIDSREYVVQDLRKQFGVVTQEGVLFNDTVIRNIAYGDPKPDLEKVKEAARIANANEFIELLPERYSSVIGERGSKLSGGQRQRISIARAVYSNPPVLILDEATSALDSESEKLVQEALNRLMKGRTSLVIAHRLSTILEADRIYVVEAGKIVESGKHTELIQREGLYRKLYEIQFAK